MRGWLVNQSGLVPVMNLGITCPPSGAGSESLGYFIFQELEGGEGNFYSESFSQGRWKLCLALLTLAGRSNLGKKPMGGTQWGSFTITRVTLVTTETQQKFERSKASPPKVAT